MSAHHPHATSLEEMGRQKRITSFLNRNEPYEEEKAKKGWMRENFKIFFICLQFNIILLYNYLQ